MSEEQSDNKTTKDTLEDTTEPSQTAVVTLSSNDQQKLKRFGKNSPTKLKETDDKESKYDRLAVDYNFHRLIQQLELHPDPQNPLIIGIASTLRGEGRTTIALGLAAALSQSMPWPVALLETDLSRPCLSEEFSLPTHGLSEYLRGELELDDLTQSITQPDLTIIPAGECKGPALEILRSERLNSLIKLLSSQYAVVVVDLPPMSMTGEVNRVIGLVDRVLMVVEAGSTPNKLVKSALELIPIEKRLGVLLNRTKPVFGLPKLFSRFFG